MKNISKMFGYVMLIVFLAMTLPAFAGGSSQRGSAAGAIDPLNPSTFPELNRSEPHEVIMYYTGDLKARQPEQFELFNRLAKAKINTTLKQNLLPTADYRTRYPLLLASGEVFDLIYAATWLNFAGLAQRGSFMPIQHLAPKYAPTVYRRQAPDAIVQSTIDGNLYCLPSLWNAVYTYGPIFRRDLLEGKGWNGQMKSLADLEVYLEMVKQNYPAMEPIQTGSGGSEIDDVWAFERGWYPIQGGTNGYLWIDPFEANPKVLTTYELPGIRTEYLELAKRWGQKGLFPQGALADTTPDKFRNGIAAARFHHLDSYDGEYRQHPDWGIDYAQLVKDLSYMQFTQDACAVASTSRRPDRALDMWEAIMSDEELYRAFYYGIEGVTYRIHNVNGQNQVEQISPAVPDLYDWTRMWSARTREFYLLTYGAPPDYQARLNEVAAAVVPGKGSQKFRSFIPDYRAVESEHANLAENVQRQYWWPLELAYVDLDTGFNEFKRASEAAGIEKVRAEVQRQLDEYIRNLK